jgi:outer membrane protein TolC
LRDLVKAKEGTRDTALIREAAGQYSRVEVVEAEIDLSEARIRLAQAEGNQARLCALLEELVSLRQEQRRQTVAKVETGAILAEVLNQVDARLNEAKARLDEARSK